MPREMQSSLSDDGKPSRNSQVDEHVGSRIRLRRTLMGMSQERLGDALNLTFQQVQKYERGMNRVGASRLFDLSQALNVPISFFFDDMPDGPKPDGIGRPQVHGPGLAEAQSGFSDEEDVLGRRETLELVRAYYRIAEPVQRERLFALIRSMAESSSS